MYGDIFSDSVISSWKNSATTLQNALLSERKDHLEMAEANAANLGVRSALAAQLELADPENPLVKDQSLIKRIQNAAESAYKKVGFNAAREAGRSFPVPGRNKEAILAVKKVPINQVKESEATAYADAYAATIAVRNAFATQLAKLDPSNPLLKDVMLIERIRAAGISAYRVCGNDLAAAREVGNTFKVPGRS